MPARQLNSLIPIVLGPDDLGAISRAVEASLPALIRATFRVLPNGNVELSDEDAGLALRALRQAVEDAFPADVRDHVGQKSGLGWNIFFGHVVAFWIPLRFRIGFLRALADRASLHGVGLSLQWNQDRPVAPRETPLGSWVLAVGTLIGMALGVLVQARWPYNPALPLLTAGAGLVAGRWYQRLVRQRVCGDHLCQAPLGHGDTRCPGCGALVAFRLS